MEERNGTMRKSPTAESVDGYLELLPGEGRVALEKLRMIIKAAAPGTTEVISYRIPVFKYQERPLVSIGATENHCSFYIMSSSMIPKGAGIQARERRGYGVGGSRIRYSPDKPLPAGLVTKLV